MRDLAAEGAAPSPGSRSRCRTWARRCRTARRRPGGALGVHRRRAAGEDHRDRVLGEHLGHRHRVRHDLAVDLRLADAAGDELGVLRAEVDDEDGAVRWGGHRVSGLPSGPSGDGERAVSDDRSRRAAARPRRRSGSAVVVEPLRSAAGGDQDERRRPRPATAMPKMMQQNMRALRADSLAPAMSPRARLVLDLAGEHHGEDAGDQAEDAAAAEPEDERGDRQAHVVGHRGHRRAP